MQGRNWIVAAIAIMLGLVAVVIANAWFSGVQDKRDQTVETQKLVPVVVATQPLEFGDRLAQQNLRIQGWPAASVPQGSFRTLAEALRDNRVALRPIVPGEPILASNVSGKDGRATLAAILPDGMRAVSVPVTAVNGVSGFVLPGTMVDVLLTRQIDGDGAKSTDLRSDVVLQNVQVLAADQSADDKDGKPKVSRTVTLAVTLYDAQRLSIAQQVGTLSLALRKVEAAPGKDGTLTSQGSLASTVTKRQLGGPRLLMPSRGDGRGMMPPAYAAAPAPPPMRPALAGPVPGSASPAGAISSGHAMTVFRGTEPTTYPVGR